jgi:hypothetical protein
MTQIDDLARLIASYQWLSREREALKGNPGGVSDGHISGMLDDVFSSILRFPSDDPRITCRQIEFLLGILADGRHDALSRKALCDAILAHVARIAGEKHSRSMRIVRPGPGASSRPL